MRNLFHPASVLCGLVLLVILVALCTDVHTPWLPKCLLHEHTGLLCYGCGSTRAVYALMRGEWAYSLQCNLLLLPSLAWLAALCFIRHPQRFNAMLYAGMGVLLLYMVLRNIPLPAFDCLRP